MSCVREASLEPPAPYHAASADPPRNGEGRKGRFLRGLRRMFRRRVPADRSPDNKSRSTSELLQDIRTRRKEDAYSSGLSVSHDSVFTGDRSADESSDERAAPVKHTSSGHRAELAAAIRRRGRGEGSDDDEDLGLPHSPPASPPTDKADKRHHAAISASSCSDGSLLSVGSSEMDDDSSRHDSNKSSHAEYAGEPPSGVAPLSHSAARHKMAVRPRRTHGAPRRNKNAPIATPALPITPELNEEMIRSTTPDRHHITEVVTESFSSSTTTKVKEARSQFTKDLNHIIETTPTDAKLKSSSLPPGLALSHLVGQSPAKLSLAENKDTPRSSIKRSKSTAQGKSLTDDIPPTKLTVSETNVNREEVRRKEEKKFEKKSEETTTRSSRKDESFFSRLLLRRSKKDPKAKKDAESSDQKKPRPPDKLVTPQYKSVDREYSSTHSEYGKIQHRTQSADRGTQVGHKIFSNQAHKRMDHKGVYTHDTAYSISKSTIDYGANDLKIAEETDKLLNMDLKYSYRPDKSKRHSKEDLKDDPFNLHMPERWKKPVQVVDPYQPKAFNKEATVYPRDSHLSTKIKTNEVIDAPIPIPRQRPKDFVFHSGSMPKNIPYFNQHFKLSASASPPKSVLLQNTDNMKKLHHSSDLSNMGISNLLPEDIPPVFGDYPITQAEKDYASELRSLGEEYIEPRTAIRTSIGKSHSFRHQSETSTINSQDQMPSLPAIVGFSENLMESWEVNYRRSVSNDSSGFNDKHNKRLSARNFGIFGTNSEQYDSLQSTDSSYLDSLKGESQVDDRKSVFVNNVLISDSRKRDSDISQIEANIDNIIGSPKLLLTSVLKSSSLDSVKGSADKHVEDRRKTISIECSLSGQNPSDEDAQEIPKSEPETYVSVTHLNKEMHSIQTKTVEQKLSKSEEKLKTNCRPGVPEFLNIQLNKVDSKPATNVVLTANITPKKPEPVVVVENIAKEGSDDEKDLNETPLQMYLRKTGSQHLLNRSLEFLGEDPPKIPEKPFVPIKNSPLNVRKSAPPIAFSQIPTTPKAIQRKKPLLEEINIEKPRTNSLNADSNEKLSDNISMDQKSYSSFGSKTSLQSSDSNEAKTPERQDDVVVYRRKPIMVPKEQNGIKNDDEPELMKVFARRSLKLKDCEAEILAQEIAESNIVKEETINNNVKSKFMKNEFNSSIKSRDSDKENDDNLENADIKIIDLDSNKEDDELPNIQSRASHFGGTHYQRSISTNSVAGIQSNTKRDSAQNQMRNEVSKYRKEIADSIPEKRLRNRTFPDPTTDREDIKGINVKNEGPAYKTDTIKRPWLKKEDDNKLKINPASDGKETECVEVKKEANSKENNENATAGATDGSPQFKGILQMRAEWERRAKQGITK